MIVNVYNKVKVDPFEGCGHDNSITFAAATTCYQSEKHTKMEPAQFVEMFKSSDHRSPLEFSWYVLYIKSDKHQIRFLWDLLVNITPYIKLTLDYTENSAVISGNGRAFYDIYEYAELYWLFDNQITTFYSSLFNKLNEVNPILFSKGTIGNDEWSITDISDSYNSEDKHCWKAFRIKNISIGCSRELNRHRTLSINERSTRYTGAGRDGLVNIVYPLDNMFTWEHDVYPLFSTIYNKFNELKEEGYKNDTIRQLLPLATITEEIVAGRISDWKHFVALRMASSAHWEIQQVASQIKQILMI